MCMCAWRETYIPFWRTHKHSALHCTPCGWAQVRLQQLTATQEHAIAAVRQLQQEVKAKQAQLQRLLCENEQAVRETQLDAERQAELLEYLCPAGLAASAEAANTDVAALLEHTRAAEKQGDSVQQAAPHAAVLVSS